MGRMSKAEAELAAAVARARQEVVGEVKAAEAAGAEAARQRDVLQDEIKKVELNRKAAIVRAEAAEKELRELKAKHGTIDKIKSQTVHDAHAKEIADELQRFDPLDISKLIMSALVKVEKHFENFMLRSQLAETSQFAPVLKKIHAARQSSCSEAKACGSALAIVLIATVDPALDSDHGVECWVKCLRLVPLARAGHARVWSNRMV